MHEPPSDSSSKKQHIENSSIQESQVSMAQTEGPVHQATATGSSTIHQTNISINLAPAHTDQESKSSLGNTSSPLNEKVPDSPKSSSSGSDIDRDDLLDRLSSCPPGIFRKVVSYMKTPAGTLSSEMSAQATRASELLDWSEHVDGSGIEKLESSYKRATQRKLTPRSNRFRLVSVVIINLLIAGSTIGLRSLGMLQPLELAAYDLFMRSRLQLSSELQDPRLLIITVDDQDIEYQDIQYKNCIEAQKNRKSSMTDTNQPSNGACLPRQNKSLTDASLSKILDKIETLNPQIIGLDIYHPEPFPVGLAKRLSDDPRFFSICKAPSPKDGDVRGVLSAENMPLESYGFSDIVLDQDGILRRHLLSMEPPDPTHRCNAHNSFSFLIALNYLYATKGMKLESDKYNNLKIGSLIFKKLPPYYGGYQKEDTQGYQILLNFRFYDSLENIALQTVSLRDVLEKGFNTPKQQKEEQSERPIVLIGTIARGEDYKDFFQTPNGEEIAGVFVQAQMISQITSAVLDKRSLIWWTSEPIELLCMLICSVVSVAVIYYANKTLVLLLSEGALLMIVVGISWSIFVFQAGYLPVIPVLLSSMLSTLSSWVFMKHVSRSA